VIAVALALALLAGPVAPSPAEESAPVPVVEPVLAARVDELRHLAAPPPLPGDRPPRLLLTGDSVSQTLAPALAAEARRRGAQVTINTRPGCGLLPGLPMTRDGFIPPWARGCSNEVPAWRGLLASTPADVVFVLSTWDGSPRAMGESVIDPASLVGHHATAQMVHSLVDDIAPVGSGRTVVFLAESIPTRGATSGDPSAIRIAEARHHRAVLRTVARADFARVRLVDLGQWLCPTGHPCPEIVEGVQVRGEDGGHFTPQGAAWIAPRLLDAIGLPAAA